MKLFRISNSKLRVANVGTLNTALDKNFYEESTYWWLIENAPEIIPEGTTRENIEDILQKTPINLKYGRDFLKETETYDIVILHWIFNPAETSVKNFIGSYGEFSLSEMHSAEAWRKRLSMSGAKYIFAFGSYTEVGASFLQDIPGYSLVDESYGSMGVYKK